MALQKVAVPDAVTQLERQFEQFRLARSGRGRLPESLWQGAVEQARQYGVNVVAHTLRLDYNALKKRMGAVVEPHRDQSPASFGELIGATGFVVRLATTPMSMSPGR